MCVVLGKKKIYMFNKVKFDFMNDVFRRKKMDQLFLFVATLSTQRPLFLKR